MWLLKLEAMAIAQCPRNRKIKCNKIRSKTNQKKIFFARKKSEIL